MAIIHDELESRAAELQQEMRDEFATRFDGVKELILRSIDTFQKESLELAAATTKERIDRELAKYDEIHEKKRVEETKLQVKDAVGLAKLEILAETERRILLAISRNSTLQKPAPDASKAYDAHLLE